MTKKLSQFIIVQNYYRKFLSSIPYFCQDIQEIILDYIMGMYMHQVKAKYLHFFKHQVMVYQRVAVDSRYISLSYCFVPRKYLTYMFNQKNTKMISYPFTCTILDCTDIHLRKTWKEICNFVLENQTDIHSIFITNWRVVIENQAFNGLPVLYYSTDVFKHKLETRMQQDGLKCYYRSFFQE